MLCINKRRSGWAAVVLLCGLLSACGAANGNAGGEAAGTPASAPATTAGEAADQPAAVRQVTDEAGHELQVPAQPARVVATYLEDPLTVLGVKPVAQWSNGDRVLDYLQPQLQGVPKIDLSGAKLPAEALLSANPDLIVLQNQTMAQNGMYDEYAKIAPTYVFQDAMKDWRKTLLTLGDVLGKGDAAQRAIADYEAKAKAARDRIRQAIGDRTVAILWVDSQAAFMLVDKDYFSGNVLYGDLGLHQPELGKGKSFLPLSLETLPDLQADDIFLIDQYGGDKAKELLASPIWKNLPAVKQGHVYEVDYGPWMTSGLLAGERTIDDAVQALVHD